MTFWFVSADVYQSHSFAEVMSIGRNIIHQILFNKKLCGANTVVVLVTICAMEAMMNASAIAHWSGRTYEQNGSLGYCSSCPSIFCE